MAVVEVGSQCTLWQDWPAGESPEEGDILRSHPGGSCYLLDEILGVRERGDRWRYRFRVTRLGKDAAPADGDGVWLFTWNKR